MGRKRNYIDLKYKFIRFLIKHEKHQRKFNYLKSAAEWTSRAIVSLELHDGPVKSVKQAQQLEAIGGNIADKLRSALNSNEDTEPPPQGEYLSSAAALLVGLYDLSEEERRLDPANDTPLIKHQDLREHCRRICSENFREPSVSFGSPVLCAAWWRINILESRLYVKKRQRDKEAVYHLLPLGIEVAERLKGKAVLFEDLEKITPPQILDETAVYSTDDGSNGVILKVDHRELGGDNGKLIQVCNLLKRRDIRFKTCYLNIGDYCWFHRRNGAEVQLPVIVERKRADDLAESLKDGRYHNQLERMKQLKNDFFVLDEHVQLIYILESDIQKYVIPCDHECVGKCGNPTLLQVMGTVSELENDPDITLIYTENLEKTVDYLANVTVELQIRIDSGEFDAILNVNNSKRKRRKENEGFADPNTITPSNLHNLFENQNTAENIIQESISVFGNSSKETYTRLSSPPKKVKTVEENNLIFHKRCSVSSSPKKPKIDKHKLHRSIKEQLETLIKIEESETALNDDLNWDTRINTDNIYKSCNTNFSESQGSDLDLPAIWSCSRSNKIQSVPENNETPTCSKFANQTSDDLYIIETFPDRGVATDKVTPPCLIIDDSDRLTLNSSSSVDCKMLYPDELSNLISMFPNKIVAELEKLLIEKCGNIELCVDALL